MHIAVNTLHTKRKNKGRGVLICWKIFQPWVDYKKMIENQAKGTTYRLDPKRSNDMLRSNKKSSSKRMVKHLNRHK